MPESGALVPEVAGVADHSDVLRDDSEDDDEHALSVTARAHSAPPIVRESFIGQRAVAVYTREFETMSAPFKFVTAWNFDFNVLPFTTRKVVFLPKATSFPFR